MGRKPASEPQTRKSLVLSDRLWARVDAARRAVPGKVPTEMDMIRALLAEALDAREAAAGMPRAGESPGDG